MSDFMKDAIHAMAVAHKRADRAEAIASGVPEDIVSFGGLRRVAGTDSVRVGPNSNGFTFEYTIAEIRQFMRDHADLANALRALPHYDREHALLMHEIAFSRSHMTMQSRIDVATLNARRRAEGKAAFD